MIRKDITFFRPVFNESEPINVTFGLNLQQIVDLVSFSVLKMQNRILKLEMMMRNLTCQPG